MSRVAPLRARHTLAVPTHSLDEAWELACELSPRASIRTAVRDATTGEILNAYPVTTPVDATAPETTWAINLTNPAREYAYLGFDFDADRGDTPEDADRDARLFLDLLEEHRIPAVLCASGPSGGRHVWIAPEYPQSAEAVRDLATAAGYLYPTLDPAPLRNPATGALRPPLAPHRSGNAASEILKGDLASLLMPSAWTSSLEALGMQLDRLAEPVRSRMHDSLADHMPLMTAPDGHPYNPRPGRRLALSPTIKKVLDSVPQDPSQAAWRILSAAANAGWTLTDVETRLLDSPGMEHLRTIRVTDTRRAPRPACGARSTHTRLAEMWERCVRWIVWEAPTVNPDSDQRALAETIHARYSHAVANPGRWEHGTGPSVFRVLIGFLSLCATARTDTIDIDVRRMGDLVGISRQTAAVALRELAGLGLIALESPAAGTRAATWRLLPTPATSDLTQTLVPPVEISHLQSLLSRYTTSWHHDALTHYGAGLTGGNAWAHAKATGTPLDPSAPTTRVLQTCGLTQARRPLQPCGIKHLPQIARQMGVDGLLAAQKRLHSLERLLWRWLLKETAWLKAPRGARWPRPQNMHDREDPTIWPRFPRRGRRLDFSSAMSVLTAYATA